jgi:hypothetical protein
MHMQGIILRMVDLAWILGAFAMMAVCAVVLFAVAMR